MFFYVVERAKDYSPQNILYTYVGTIHTEHYLVYYVDCCRGISLCLKGFIARLEIKKSTTMIRYDP